MEQQASSEIAPAAVAGDDATSSQKPPSTSEIIEAAKVKTAPTGNGAETKSGSPTTASSSGAPTSAKCAKCGKRYARRGCTHSACLTCCDDTNCATHNEAREQAQWKEQIMAGTTPLQLLAKEKRSKAIPAGRFKEGNFSYLGDTVVLWDLKQYLSNPSWRDDAVRKSKKRRTRQLNHDLSSSAAAAANIGSSLTTNKAPTKKCRRQRFDDAMETLFKQSLSSS